MLSIKQNIDQINKQIFDTAVSCGRKPEDIQLIAVTKKKNRDTIMEGVKAGAVHLGENYIQEAVDKIDIIGKEGICWHFIGHLQSNKAKLAVQYFEYIHTVDTFKLAKEINKHAEKMNKIQKILLQVNIAREETKSGTGIKEATDLVKQVCSLANISLQGLMCMPPYFPNPEQSRTYFRQLFQLKEKVTGTSFDNVSMKHLSMGMSNDFKVAIEEGATMVRVGTAIFGSRN